MGCWTPWEQHVASWSQILSSGFIVTSLRSWTIYFWSLYLIHLSIRSFNKHLLSLAPASHHWIGCRSHPHGALDLEEKEKIINNYKTVWKPIEKCPHFSECPEGAPHPAWGGSRWGWPRRRFRDSLAGGNVTWISSCPLPLLFCAPFRQPGLGCLLSNTPPEVTMSSWVSHSSLNPDFLRSKMSMVEFQCWPPHPNFFEIMMVFVLMWHYLASKYLFSVLVRCWPEGSDNDSGVMRSLPSPSSLIVFSPGFHLHANDVSFKAASATSEQLFLKWEQSIFSPGACLPNMGLLPTPWEVPLCIFFIWLFLNNFWLFVTM